jgi:hypothetical protein
MNQLLNLIPDESLDDPKVVRLVETGNASERIAAVAREIGVDLTVLGTHDYGVMHNFLLGGHDGQDFFKNGVTTSRRESLERCLKPRWNASTGMPYLLSRLAKVRVLFNRPLKGERQATHNENRAVPFLP